MSYPGGKAGAGVYQRIINLIPPHRVYIEPFLGGGAVFLNKRRARSSIVIDRDERSLNLVRSSLPARAAATVEDGEPAEYFTADSSDGRPAPDKAMQACTFICDDGIKFLSEYSWRGDEFVYCDPPYVMSTRRSGPLYRFEMTDSDHELLISTLLAIPAAIMVSGYASELYDGRLREWRRIEYKAMTRGGFLADEVLWLNYDPPVLLHDDRYLGENFRDRERIKRKRRRWKAKFEGLAPAERSAIFRDLSDVVRGSSND